MYLYCCSMQFGWYVDCVDSTTSNTILFVYVINGVTENLSHNSIVTVDLQDSGILSLGLPLLRCGIALRAVYEAQQFSASCCTHERTHDTLAHSELSESSKLSCLSVLRDKQNDSSFSPKLYYFCIILAYHF